MKIYLAGAPRISARQIEENRIPSWFPKAKRKLFSYWYVNDHGQPDVDVHYAFKHQQDLFLDSGAFTAFTKGVVIDPKDYAGFIKRSPAGCWQAVSNLDAIGRDETAARKTYENQKTLESLGVIPSPVFHVREPDSFLERYLADGYDYIFIGGMVGEDSSYLLQRLDELFTHYLTDASGRAIVRLHGFGITNQELMFRYPWYSVDSSTWHKAAIYGACTFMIGEKIQRITFTERSPHRRDINAPHFESLPAPQQAQVLEWLERFGTTLEAVATSIDERAAVNAEVYSSVEDRGTETFKQAQAALF